MKMNVMSHFFLMILCLYIHDWLRVCARTTTLNRCIDHECNEKLKTKNTTIISTIVMKPQVQPISLVTNNLEGFCFWGIPDDGIGVVELRSKRNVSVVNIKNNNATCIISNDCNFDSINIKRDNSNFSCFVKSIVCFVIFCGVLVFDIYKRFS